MQKSLIFLLSLLILLPVSGHASEEEKDSKVRRGYIGLGLLQIDSTLNNAVITGGLADASTDQIELRLGYRLFKNIAIETRLGGSVDRYHLTDHGNLDSYEIENYASAYLRLQTPDFGRYHLYALAGYSIANASSSTGDTEQSGTSWGIGLAMNLDPGAAIGIEYTRLIDNDTLETNSYGIFFQYQF